MSAMTETAPRAAQGRRGAAGATRTSLRQLLLGLVLALAIPMVLVAAAGLRSIYRAERQATDLRLQETTRALALSLDLEIEKAEAALRILSLSPHIRNRDFAAFQEQLIETHLKYALWIGLFEPSGRTLVNTLVPFGGKLSDSIRPDTLKRIAATGEADLSNLVHGPITGQNLVTLDVPVLVDGKVAYILGMGLDPEVFHDIIADQQIAASWRAAVLDRSGKVVARSHNPERYVGKFASPELLDAIAAKPEGDVASRTLDGLEVRSYFTRSPTYGWSFVIGYPTSELSAALRRPLVWLLALGAVIVTGLVLAALLSRAIARPVDRLVAQARGLGGGIDAGGPPLRVRECDAIQMALTEAAARIRVQAQEREQVLAQVAESEMRLRLALDAGDLGSWEYDPATGDFTTSPTCRANFGRDPDRPFAYDDLVAAIHPEDRPKQAAAVREALANRTDLRVEYRAIWPDRSEHWIRISGRTRVGAHGLTLVGVSQDITARRQADERQAILLHELNHRVKNTLATVQSIASLTRRSAEAGDPSAWDAFLGRLQGLAGTNDLLTATNWSGATLEDVLRRELDLYQDAPRQRIRLRGPRVSLQPGAVLAFGLAVHELATNAAKYGSLSQADGRLHVMWALTSGSGPASLLVEWVESDGPPVTPPQRQGFGSRLIQRGLAQQLGGEIKLAFAPTGVRCVISFPVSGVVMALDEGLDGEESERRAS